MTEPVVQKIIKLDNVRLLRVSLTKPYVGKGAKIDPATGKAEGKYHIDGVFPPTHPQFTELQSVIRGVATACWKELTQQTLDMIKGNNQRFPLQKGDQYRPGKPAYAGMIYLSAGNKDQPTILVTENGVNLSNRGMPVLTPAHPCWPYEGSYANVLLEFYTYLYGNSPGLGCSVLGVQFYKHGERLKGSSVATGSEFGLVPADADANPAATAPQGSAGLI
jgi:ssDNA-binding protein